MAEKSNIITAFVLDFETGGLDCVKCAATQISIHAVRLDTFDTMEKLNLYIKPYYYKANAKKVKKRVLKSKYEEEDEDEVLMTYTDSAEKVSGITLDKLYDDGLELEEVCQSIIDFVTRNTFEVQKAYKPIIVGQNILFDMGFMQQIMVYTGKWEEFCKLFRTHKDYFGNEQIYYLDTILLSQLALCHDKSVISYKLELVAERLSVELDDAHDADADVTATADIVRVLSARMRSDEGSISSVTFQKKKKTRDHFKI